MAVTETIKITEKTVRCDGGKGAHGHPAVFLTVDPKTKEVTCPYCSRHFIYEGGGH